MPARPRRCAPRGTMVTYLRTPFRRVISVAPKTAKPGTQEFREGIRQALLSEKNLVAS